jgi:hypothetical protein
MVIATIDGYDLMKGKVVKFFPNRGYGFIHYQLDDGLEKDIFFHWNDGTTVFYDDFDLTLERLDFDYDSNQPNEGDSMLFAVGKGSKGRAKAFPWCFEQDYLKAKAKLEEDTSWMEEEDGWEEDEPQEVNLGDGPGGFKIYE